LTRRGAGKRIGAEGETVIKPALIIPILLTFAACHGAPAPARSDSQPYSVISEQADRSAGDLLLEIRLDGRPSQSEVRSITELIIANRKGEYRAITIRSFLAGAGPGSAPYAVSKLEGDRLTHQFNSPPAETQKIPTH
jgi:hypothetical protein